MRVLQVINNLNTGGAEKLLLEAIPKFNEFGVETDLLVLNNTKYPFLKKIKKIGVCQVYSLSNGSVYNPMHIIKLRKYFKYYDLLHVHLFPSLYWVAISKIFSFYNIPLVFTEHNTTNKRRKFILFKRLDKLIYGAYSRIIVISESVDYHLKKDLRISNDKIKMILNGVDLEKIYNASPYSKEELGLKNSEKIILQVSSFTKQKDQKTLIRALTHLDTRCRLLLVGDGVLIDESKKLVEELGLNLMVSFLGIRMDVPRLLKTADIVVLSTYFEGLSLASIEGLASGRPFIASDAPGLSSIVEGAGLLFPIGDHVKLASIIEQLLTNEEIYLQTVETCLLRAKGYGIDQMIEKHYNLYTELCQNQS